MPISADEALARARTSFPVLAGLPPELAARLEALAPEDWTVERIEAAVRTYAEELGLSAGKLIHPMRLSITGKRVGAGMFETMAVLGRDISLERLRSYARSAQPTAG